MHFRFKFIIVNLLFLVMLGCSKRLINPSFHKTTEQLQLGEIGEDKNLLLDKNYAHTAIPLYNSPIKVNVQIRDFKPSSYKTFQKANKKQSKQIAIAYTDSIETKPKYIELRISDRVATLNALNSIDNKDLKAYLNNKFNSHLISEVSIVFPKDIQNKILKAEEVFIKNYGVKSYALYLYNNGSLTCNIKFSEGIVFGYKTSNFCWKKIKNAQWDIVDILEENKRCSRGTYRFPNTTPKDIDDYLKF